MSDRRRGTRLCSILVRMAITLSLAVRPLSAQLRVEPKEGAFWIAAAAGLAAAASLDPAGYRFSLQHRTRLLDRWAEAGDELGTGRNLIAAMAASWGAARLAGHPKAARHVLHVAAAYTLGNVAESALKPLVGRHRPDGASDAWRSRPFGAEGVWHSFPSAHAMHAFTVAAAVADESGAVWLARAGYGAAAIVAWSRVYRLEHWPSDVVGSAIIAIATARTTVAWLHR